MMALDFPVGGVVYVQTEDGMYVPLGSSDKSGLSRDSLLEIAGGNNERGRIGADDLKDGL